MCALEEEFISKVMDFIFAAACVFTRKDPRVEHARVM